MSLVYALKSKYRISLAAILMLVVSHSYAQMTLPCAMMLGMSMTAHIQLSTSPINNNAHSHSEHIERVMDDHAEGHLNSYSTNVTVSDMSHTDTSCCDQDCACPEVVNQTSAEFDFEPISLLTGRYFAQFRYAFSVIETPQFRLTKPPISN